MAEQVVIHSLRNEYEERIQKLKLILNSLATRVPKIIIPRIEVLLPALHESNRVEIREENILQHRSCRLCSRECITIKKSPELRYYCSICRKMFSNSTCISRHMNTVHSNVFRHKCEKCQKKFKRSDHLKAHVKTCNGLQKRKRLACNGPMPHITS